jgi:hypothetical protein
MTGTNLLPYLIYSSATQKKSFMTLTPVINAIKLFSGLPMEKSKKLECRSLQAFFQFHPCQVFAKKAGDCLSGVQVLQYALPAYIRRDTRGLTNLLPYLIYSSATQKKVL